MLAVARRLNDGGPAIKPNPAAGILIEIKKRLVKELRVAPL
jgi:hypothetical protein